MEGERGAEREGVVAERAVERVWGGGESQSYIHRVSRVWRER